MWTIPAGLFGCQASQEVLAKWVNLPDLLLAMNSHGCSPYCYCSCLPNPVVSLQRPLLKNTWDKTLAKGRWFTVHVCNCPWHKTVMWLLCANMAHDYQKIQLVQAKLRLGYRFYSIFVMYNDLHVSQDNIIFQYSANMTEVEHAKQSRCCLVQVNTIYINTIIILKWI